MALGKTLLSIGRDPSNDLVLPDAMVSRRHAVIEYRGNQYYLRDCNSSNGSLVNGDRVTECRLHDGDLVAIGTVRLLFREDPVVDASGKIVHHPSAPRLQCPSCQADYRKGDGFCRQCGTALTPSGPSSMLCVACGTAILLPAHFCSGCGRPLDSEAGPEVTRPRPLGGEQEPDTGGGAGDAESAGERRAALEVPPSILEPIPETAPVERAEAEPPPPVPPALPQGTPARPGARLQPRLAEQAGNRPAPAASLGRRAAAALLDGVLVSLFAAALLTPAVLYWRSRNFATENPSFVAILLTLALLPLVTAAVSTYFIYFWGAKGATLGKRLLGLRVETVEGVTPIGLGRATLRFLGYLLSAGFFGIGFLMGAFEGGALHDRIAATRVVRRERG